MPAIEVGRVCVKLSGREAGRKCIIIEVMDKSFVLITGPKKITGIKRRRANVNHVEPLQDKLEVERDASDEDVEKALKDANLLESMSQIVKPVIA